MPFKIITAIIFSLFLLSQAQASYFDLSSYEKDLSYKLKAEPREKYFYIYSLAGRELMDQKLYLSAQKYFTMALQEDNNNEDKTQIYIRMLQVNYHRNAKKEAKENHQKLVNYWSSHRDLEKKNRSLYSESMLFLESWIFSETPELIFNTQKNNNKKGAGGDLFFKNTSYLHLFKQGKYTEALELLDREKILNSRSVDLQAEYDLLLALTQRKNLINHQFLCTKLWKKYQKSYSYGILICGLLNELQLKGKIPEAKEQELDDYFQTFDEEMIFLTKAIKQLQQPDPVNSK